MPAKPLRTLKCPNCSALLETNLGFGQSLPCPDCEQEFTVARNQVQLATGAMNEGLVKLLIPVGYALFLIIPLGGIIYWATSQKDRPKEEVVEARPTEKQEKKPAAPELPPRTSRPPKKVPDSHDSHTGSPSLPLPSVPPEDGTSSTPVVPAVPAVNVPVAPIEIALAPIPHEALPEIPIAPFPREVFWTIASTFSTKWETVGAVDVRVARVAIAKYPILDPSKNTTTESQTPALVIVIEARLNDPKKDRSLLSWTHGILHYSRIYLDGGGDKLEPRSLTPGTRLHTGLTYPIPLPKDGATVRDVILFETPPEGTKELELHLDSERIQQSGSATFTIPVEAWKK
jgi:hypothetical protein